MKNLTNKIRINVYDQAWRLIDDQTSEDVRWDIAQVVTNGSIWRCIENQIWCQTKHQIKDKTK